MSDSELSSAEGAIPPAATIEQTLKRIVRNAVKNEDEITVKSARSLAESELGLDSGFFRDDPEWKARSKSVIEAAVNAPETPAKAKPVRPAPARAKPAAKRKSEDSEEKPTKRAKKSAPEASDATGEEASKPAAKRKRKPQKAEVVEDDESEVEEVSKPPVKSISKAQNGKKPSIKSTVLLSNDVDESNALSDPPDVDGKADAADTKVADDDSDSDMSVLLDEAPAKTKPRKKPTDAAPRTKKLIEGKKPSNAEQLSPNEEEIKRLQGWLVKCGLRKLWYKELAPYDTDKAKIAHLKGMLNDVGMTGRYSAEKAKSIKEARELKEEIEAAKDFAKQWGTAGKGKGRTGGGGGDEAEDEDCDEEEEKVVENTRRRPGGRVLPKGLVDFGDSGDDGSD
ncbi:hypothetical protein B0A48_14463 [Cryoendolithus antarcticus]|uniref:Transcriptional regulator n=1 Tax=Cryoendolithus antarcticus TaxID=1507870 RepID=A0A1V8SKU7_9PEZI|nr:hypothetical protein B0A48_14463 [Cryoendolithus antarcticus]